MRVLGNTKKTDCRISYSKEMNISKLLVLGFFVFASVEVVLAQTPPPMTQTGESPIRKTGKIKGRVIDAESKSPMEYANIAVYRKPDAKLVTGGITNNAGVFEIGELPLGNYSLEAVFIGFGKTTISDVKISPNDPNVDMGTIELTASQQNIGTVDVVAERNRVEYKIDKKVINVTNDINAAGGTAITVLENTPSVEVDIDGNVSLRGSSSFTVMIDGRPSVLSGSDALKQIPSSAIQNIEIITNPSAKYEPDGMAGIINVVMKKNVLSGVNGIVNLNLGTGKRYGTDLLLNYKTKKYNVFVGANWNDNTDEGTMASLRETYNNDTTTYLSMDGLRNHSRGGKQLKGGIDYFLTEKTSLSFSGEVGNYDFSSEGGGKIHEYRQPGNYHLYSVQANNSLREGNYASGNLSFLSKFDESGQHKLEGSVNYRRRDGLSSSVIDESVSDAAFNNTGNYLSRVITNEDDVSDDYRLKLDYTLPLANKSKLEAGIQSRMERETELFSFKNYNPATGGFVNNPKFTSDMDFREDIHAMYVTYSGSLKPVQYMLGMRGEYTNRSIDHSKVSTPYTIDRFDYFPSLHLSYDMSASTQLMSSYSRRINRPDGRDLDPFPSYMNQYTIRMGNPDLQPEYTDSYELNYMYKFGNSFLSFESFYRTTNNLITRIQELKDDGIFYMTSDNLNRDHSLGAEVMGNLNLTKWLLLNTSFSLYNYKLKGEVLGKSVDKQSTNYSGRFNATLKFSPDSRMQITGFYRGPSVSAQGDQKGFFSTNVAYRQELMKKKLSATLSVSDVFGSMKINGNSQGDNFKSTFKMQREPRVLMLTLSYKINNYKIDRQAPSEQQGMGGGMDDMF